MKKIQTTTSVTAVTGQSTKQTEETLPSGESVSRAITMGGKMCCGSAFNEHTSD
jgi:hypothetical protein